MKSLLAIAAFLLIGGGLMADTLLIDDFSSGTGRAKVGGSWQGFTDRVMGGLSEINAGLVQEGGTFLLRMEGNLSLENNGGFVQVRLPFDTRRLGLDLRQYTGLRITYRKIRQGDYAVHLRSSSNPRPWAHHSAMIEADRPADRDGFLIADLPWSTFAPDRTRTAELPLQEVTSLAIVAVKNPGPISIDLASLELYK
jgi:hypothetical protein